MWDILDGLMEYVVYWTVSWNMWYIGWFMEYGVYWFMEYGYIGRSHGICGILDGSWNMGLVHRLRVQKGNIFVYPVTKEMCFFL